MLQGAPGTTARRPGSPRHSYSASSCLGARAGPPHRALGCVLHSRPHTLLLSPLAAACRQAAAAAACLSAPRPPSAPACDAAEARPGCTAAATVCEATSAHSRYLPHSLSTRLAGIPLTGSRGDKHGGSQGPWGRAYPRCLSCFCRRAYPDLGCRACLSGVPIRQPRSVGPALPAQPRRYPVTRPSHGPAASPDGAP